MANEKRLTEEDEIAYHAIEKFIKENGYPPSVRELCRITGKSSTATIQYRLKSLEQKGYIKTNSMGKRTIRIIRKIEDAPTVDAVEVVHGHWISLTDCSNAGVYCSICYKKVWKEDYAWCNRKNKLRSNYCPNCGAKMDGGLYEP